MATKVKKSKPITISESLFGVSPERADELIKIVENTMNTHSTHNDPPSHKPSKKEVAEHWQTMFGEMIVFGKTENERMWIVFVFAAKYVQFGENSKQQKMLQQIMGAFGKLFE